MCSKPPVKPRWEQQPFPNIKISMSVKAIIAKCGAVHRIQMAPACPVKLIRICLGVSHFSVDKAADCACTTGPRLWLQTGL